MRTVLVTGYAERIERIELTCENGQLRAGDRTITADVFVNLPLARIVTDNPELVRDLLNLSQGDLRVSSPGEVNVTYIGGELA